MSTATTTSLLPSRTSTTATMTLASPTRRPTYKRASSSSRSSPGWYETDNVLTLDDIAARLDTLLGRFGRWQGKCAQSVVMALLLNPTPTVVLVAFNPVTLLAWIGIVVWWLFMG